jgi:hypothetical protein
VDGVLADEPFERPGEIDHLTRDLVLVVGLLQLGAGLHALVEIDLRALRDELRDLVDGPVRDVEHSPRVADGRTGHHRPEGDDLRDAVAPVLLGDVVDDLVAPVHGEVDVDVGHRLAARVEEALEEEVVLHRVDVGDLEAVGDEGAGRRPAARADADAVPLRERDEIPDDQEVIREAHLANGLQLELQAIGELWRDRSVPLLQPFFAELDEVVEGVAVAGDGVLGQQDPPKLHRHVAALGDLERALDRLRVVGEVLRHLGRRLEVELVGVEAPAVRVCERVARLDAEKRLVRPCVFVTEIVDIAGGDERETGRLRERRQVCVDPLLDLDPRVLDLEVGRIRPEDVTKVRDLLLGLGRVPVLECLADAPG